MVSNRVVSAPWCELEFEMGPRRRNAQFSALWHAQFELFVPIERALGLVYRLLLRERADALCLGHGVEIGPETTRVESETAHQRIPLPVSAE